MTRSEKIKELHSQIEKLMNSKVPKCVSERIAELLPTGLPVNDEEEGLFITQVYTVGEYNSVLLLYDKKYESSLHKYGTYEELLYSYKKVTPGVLKEHRVRSDRGVFNNIKDYGKKSKIDSNPESNVFLIKRIDWDNLKYDGYKVSYTIYVYNRNNFIESNRRENMKNVISKAKEEMTKGMNYTNGDKSEIN